METNIITRTESEVQFSVILNEEYLKPIKTEVLDRLRGRVKAAGFRPGKAPDAIVERELGADTVQGEVIDHALQHAYPDAVKQHALQIVSSPKVALEKFVPYTELQFKVTA